MSLSRSLFESSHSVVMGYGYAYCARCGEHISNCRYEDIKQWMRTPCQGDDYSSVLSQSRGEVVRVPRRLRIWVADRLLHDSHELRVFRHLFFCQACGKVAGLRVMQLGSECLPLVAADFSGRYVPHGVRNLRRLGQQRLPQGTPCWPDQVPVSLRGHQILL